MSAMVPRPVAAAVACVLVCVAVSQAQAPAVRVSLSPDEMRVFLKEAKILRTKKAGKGVTDTIRATLSDGRVTHDAQIQTVDDFKNIFQAGAKSEVNFKDTYKFNIAGYELARLIGLANVPMSVERQYEGKTAAFTWWLDDLLVIDGTVIDEETRIKKKISSPDPLGFTQQFQIMLVFDELIQNVDRNRGNAMWGKDWKLWMVDHTRAFRLGRELKRTEELERCERGLLEGMRRLSAEALTAAVGQNLTKQEVDAVMARRDLLVRHFDGKIAERGEAAVLFTFPPAIVAVR